jgi:hypothetical protein
MVGRDHDSKQGDLPVQGIADLKSPVNGCDRSQVPRPSAASSVRERSHRRDLRHWITGRSQSIRSSVEAG